LRFFVVTKNYADGDLEATGFLLGLIGLTVLAGFAGGVGAGASVGLMGFIPGLTTDSKAALRAAINKSNSIFPAA
jgi:hypothetical protein